MVKNVPDNAGDIGSAPGSGDPLKKGMAPHSSILGWRMPWTEDPGGLQSMGLQRVDTIERGTLSLFHFHLKGDTL